MNCLYQFKNQMTTQILKPFSNARYFYSSYKKLHLSGPLRTIQDLAWFFWTVQNPLMPTNGSKHLKKDNLKYLLVLSGIPRKVSKLAINYINYRWFYYCCNFQAFHLTRCNLIVIFIWILYNSYRYFFLFGVFLLIMSLETYIIPGNDSFSKIIKVKY